MVRSGTVSMVSSWSERQMSGCFSSMLMTTSPLHVAPVVVVVVLVVVNIACEPVTDCRCCCVVSPVGSCNVVWWKYSAVSELKPSHTWRFLSSPACLPATLRSERHIILIILYYCIQLFKLWQRKNRPSEANKHGCWRLWAKKRKKLATCQLKVEG